MRGSRMQRETRTIPVGKKSAVEIYEVLGLASNFPQDPPWLTEFARALESLILDPDEARLTA